MFHSIRSVIVFLLTVLTYTVSAADSKVVPSKNGIAFPEDYKQWSPIGVSHRTDNETLRLILANPIAKRAIDAGKTNPWPNGSILGKIVWKDSTHQYWQTATVPGKMIHTEFMVKDTKKYKKTGGWGYARWLGKNKNPYGGVSAEKECYQCHLKVKNTDLVFTRPVTLP
ncbi:MAG: cytochrome P460 family protein [Methylococcales bacterium]